jgi:hypothetical protein
MTTWKLTFDSLHPLINNETKSNELKTHDIYIKFLLLENKFVGAYVYIYMKSFLTKE